MNLRSRIQALRDEIDLCSDILKQDGFLSYGSKGQPVAHPLIAARHAAMTILYKLESQLPEDPGPSPLDLFLNEELPGFDG